MKLILTTLSLFLCFITFSQSIRVDGTVTASELGAEIGQITFFTLPDSSLKKGSYIDSNYFSVIVPASNGTDFFAKIKLRGYVDTLINFQVTDTVIHLGVINLQRDLQLETVEVVYREPLYERTMDGIKVNVEGTTLETLDNLFEVLKSSPKISSPDDESIEIIGKGAPLILIDRQPILTNDELKAIPADMIEKIEIITNPSAKYKAQGGGGGVIEVYTKNFRLEGYNMNISLSGGVNTELKPTMRGGVGLSMKKKKFSLNMYLNANYRAQNSYGGSSQVFTDSSNRTTNSTYSGDGWNLWQHFSFKTAYRFNDQHKITGGVRGGGSVRYMENLSSMEYLEDNAPIISRENVSGDNNTWLSSSAFLNYLWETDTNKSNFEVNLNYKLKINEGKKTVNGVYEDIANSIFTDFDVQNDSRNRPHNTELRATYEHIFDTTGWKFSVGGAYSMIINGMKFDQLNLVNGGWVVDPIYSNSYDYVEQIGSVFAEVTKNWKKVSVRAGVNAEYTNLNGYSNSLSKQFIDSVYALPFPSASIMLQPNDNVSVTLSYSSGIRRPQFSNYDPFVRIQDSLSIQYGNPYLRPSIKHNFGFNLDLFYFYGLSVDYSYTDRPSSTLSFVEDSTFLLNSTPWNADHSQNLSVSLFASIKTKWMTGWNSVWMGYNKFDFTPEFGRPDFYNVTFGAWSSLSFFLPKDFTLNSRLHVMRWGNENSVSNARANWTLKLTKKLLNNDLRIFVEVTDIIPPTFRSNSFATNYEGLSTSRYSFTTFKLGVYFKFGRLKQEAQIKESKSGQSERI